MIVKFKCSNGTWGYSKNGKDVEGQKQELTDAFIEKIVYVYNYILWFEGDELCFTEKGYREKALQVDLYWKNGVYYFVPLKDCDTELEIGGVTRRVESNEFQENCYIFCTLHQRNGAVRDNGLWALYYDTSVRREEAEKLIYLGMAEIDTTGEEKPEIIKCILAGMNLTKQTVSE